MEVKDAADTAAAAWSDITVENLSPRRPFVEVLQALRDADREGRLDTACRLLVYSYRPVLRRAAYQLVHARGLETECWIELAQEIAEQVVLDELPATVRARIPVAGLLMILRSPMDRAWAAHCRSAADPNPP